MQYILLEDCLPEQTIIDSLLSLHNQIFHTSSASLLAEIQVKTNFLLLLAIDHHTVVGYKIGYRKKQHCFYSWLGAVHPNYRGKGIASHLMEMQHDWCVKHHYQVIQTKTKNKWRNMLILNLKHGFDIIGTYTDEKGEPKIILEKRLNK
ncbi:GNAT family N-acetyltransferase [Microbacteriaceae bacterium 4G12]